MNLKLFMMFEGGVSTQVIFNPRWDLMSRNKDTVYFRPDEETLHEVQGLALIAGKKLLVRVLEPGRKFPWGINMLSPWHVNTDKYHMSFGITDSYQTPHLLFNCL